MKKGPYPLSKVYGLLEPGPVLLLSTADRARANVMTLSWQTMMEFDPPLVGCVVSDRNYSFGLLKKNKDCVLNIPTAALANVVVRCGNISGRNHDKFEELGLTAKPASRVRAPLVDECYASLECRVVDTRFVRKYGLFVLEVVRAWVDRSVRNPKTLHHRGRGRFVVAGRTLVLSSRKK